MPNKDISEASRFKELLVRNLAGLHQLTGEQLDQLFCHYERLKRWNRVLNLTTVSDLETAVTRHYSESLFVGHVLPRDPTTVADIGSGAGFPGLPLAVLRPDCRFTLVESHKRKAVFLKEATRELRNVSVVSTRAEDLAGPYGWIVSRAVRPQGVLRLAPKLSCHFALLVSGAEWARLESTGNFVWDSSLQIPWSRENFLVRGHYVPRETESSEVPRGT